MASLFDQYRLPARDKGVTGTPAPSPSRVDRRVTPEYIEFLRGIGASEGLIRSAERAAR